MISSPSFITRATQQSVYSFQNLGTVKKTALSATILGVVAGVLTLCLLNYFNVYPFFNQVTQWSILGFDGALVGTLVGLAFVYLKTRKYQIDQLTKQQALDVLELSDQFLVTQPKWYATVNAKSVGRDCIQQDKPVFKGPLVFCDKQPRPGYYDKLYGSTPIIETGAKEDVSFLYVSENIYLVGFKNGQVKLLVVNTRQVIATYQAKGEVIDIRIDRPNKQLNVVSRLSNGQSILEVWQFSS
jgi:hypothetical protein